MHYVVALIWLTIVLVMGYSSTTEAAKLAIVIDDVGYRPSNDRQILQLPVAVSIAILPAAPHRLAIAELAHRQGREILIHMPMAPISKQPLEVGTLFPYMNKEEIQQLIAKAIQHVPYAAGMNNHMGSAMTADLAAMRNVMHTLSPYHLYFLDSMTIGNSQVSQAAKNTGVCVLKRQVFLDDLRDDAAIRSQLKQATHLARRQGSAIAIGHPHTETLRTLSQMLPQLPADIVLVKPSALLNRPLCTGQSASPSLPINPWCPMPLPKRPVTPADALKVFWQSLQTLSFQP